jgi:Mrp family chromosome partitioning ATPase
VIPPPHRLALAVGAPHEARVLALLEDPALLVAGRGCAVTVFCSSVREVREALARTDSVDLVVMSSTLQAVPPATLRELIQIGRPIVLLAPDPTASHWAAMPAPVLGLVGPDTDGAALGAAIGEALLGRRPAGARSSTTPSKPGRGRRGPTAPPVRGSEPNPLDHFAQKSEVITISSAESSDGETSAVAVSLAYALSFAAPTVLLDVNSRGSNVEFHLEHIDPARGLPELGRRHQPTGEDWQPALETDVAWSEALEAELQPMGRPGQGWVGCGISKPTYRQYLSADLLQRVVTTLRATRRFVVLDSSGSGWFPSDPDLDRAALQQADRVLLVLRPDEQGIERARRVLGDATNRHREKIGLVLNQVGLPGTDDAIGWIEYELGAPVVASLPFDPHHMAAARAHHRPVVLEPGSRVEKPLLALASRLAGGGPIRLPASPRTSALSPWWRRLTLAATGLLR